MRGADFTAIGVLLTVGLYPRMRGADTVVVLSGVLDVALPPHARG